VIPAVALRHPDHFFAIGDVVPELLARVGEERPRLLADDGAGFSIGGVDFDDAIDLMSALVVLERDGAAVFAPLQAREIVGVRK
jgi:hypothetical protein